MIYVIYAGIAVCLVILFFVLVKYSSSEKEKYLLLSQIGPLEADFWLFDPKNKTRHKYSGPLYNRHRRRFNFLGQHEHG